MLLRKKLKKALALILLISFVSTTTLANPQPGKFSRVLEGTPVPFDSWCFDDVATAKIQVTAEFADERCKLRLDKELEKQQARYSLDVQNLNLRISSLVEEKNNILAIKNQEIEQLTQAALKRPNDYSVWWATGGVVVGILSTLLIASALK
tara:strand:+ start:176 stop:628 length:453 start_codon:yes stop_codon:yes gene_type:complete